MIAWVGRDGPDQGTVTPDVFVQAAMLMAARKAIGVKRTTIASLILAAAWVIFPVSGSNDSEGQEKPAAKEQNKESSTAPRSPRNQPLPQHHDGDIASKPDASGQRDKATDPRFSWVNILQAFGALATVAYAVVTTFMLCSIKRQTYFMKQQSMVSRRTLGAIRRQANTMADQAEISRDTLGTTKRQADTMDRQTGILEASVHAAESQARSAEAAAKAASDIASAAEANTKTLRNFERPWVLGEDGTKRDGHPRCRVIARPERGDHVELHDS